MVFISLLSSTSVVSQVRIILCYCLLSISPKYHLLLIHLRGKNANLGMDINISLSNMEYMQQVIHASITGRNLSAMQSMALSKIYGIPNHNYKLISYFSPNTEFFKDRH